MVYELLTIGLIYLILVPSIFQLMKRIFKNLNNMERKLSFQMVGVLLVLFFFPYATSMVVLDILGLDFLVLSNTIVSFALIISCYFYLTSLTKKAQLS